MSKKNISVYPSITSISGIEKVKEKISEICDLRLKEVCFFPTCLSFEERKKIYPLLENSSIVHIPLVHLREDIIEEEIKYFQTRFQTNLFNVHSYKEFPLPSLSKEFFKNNVYLETTVADLTEEIGGYAGVCADFSHIEYWKACNSQLYDDHMKILENYYCGVSHISASFPLEKDTNEHLARKNGDFNYLKNYLQFIPETCAMELENSISEQLKYISYIKKNILKSI